MIAELISTGTELLLGQIVNTNAPYIASRLATMGISVYFQTTVGDNRARMEEVILQALSRSDIVITTGGLGPTLGDITKEVSASVFGRQLHIHNESAEKIKEFFAQRRIEMAGNNLRQAMMPDGAIIMPNARGTAPGVILEKGSKVIINLPGPPYEAKGMFEDTVIPYLIAKYHLTSVIHSRVLRCVGIGESTLEEQIRDLILNQGNPTIALLARNGEIHVRLTAFSDHVDGANRLLDTLEQKIRDTLGRYIFGMDEDTLAKVVGKTLNKHSATVACAESCTGGLLSSSFTDISGSSAYFKEGIICYSNEAKIKRLGVNPDTIAKYGAVSEQTAREMATGIRKCAAVDFGISVTGIAGPGGATVDKPVGLVYIGLATPQNTIVREFRFHGSRSLIRSRAVLNALDMLRLWLVTT